MYGHYNRDTDCRRSLWKRHASEWRIIKSQHRRGPLWPLGKDGQEQTWLNERRSFSRYGARPAYKLAGIFYLRHRYQGLCGRAPILSWVCFWKCIEIASNLSVVPRVAIILFRHALVGISMPVYECRRWNHNAHSNFGNAPISLQFRTNRFTSFFSTVRLVLQKFAQLKNLYS